MSADEIGIAVCDHCGCPFEDFRVAIEQSGGWCPACDRPARKDPDQENNQGGNPSQ